MFSRWFVLIALFLSPLLSAWEGNEKWTIYNAPELWHDSCAKRGVSPEELTEALQQVGVTLEQKEAPYEPWRRPFCTVVPFMPILNEETDPLVWEDEETAVYLPSARRAFQQVWITLKMPVQSLAVCSDAQLSALYATAQKVLAIYRSWNIQHQVIAFRNIYDMKTQEERLCIELIPAHPERKDELDFHDKLRSHLWVYFHRSFSPLPSMNQEHHLWRFLDSKNTSLSVNGAVRTVVNIHEAMVLLRQQLYEELMQMGLVLQREKSSGEPPSPCIHQIPIFEPCPFCSEKILQRQKVFEGESCIALYDFKPVHPFGHYLVLPKRHCVKFCDLYEPEFLELMHGAKDLASVLKPCVVYIQDGVAVGQSVAHLHLHVVQNPSLLELLTYVARIRVSKPVSDEHLTEAISRMRTAFGR